MKIGRIIFCLLLAQVSAAFFDEFHHHHVTTISVLESLSKLITDVVSIVRKDIDSFIHTMRSILDRRKPLPDSMCKCNEQADQSPTNSIQNGDTPSSNIIKINEVANRNQLPNKDHFQETNTCSTTVTGTLSDVTNELMSQIKINNIDSVLKNNTSTKIDETSDVSSIERPAATKNSVFTNEINVNSVTDMDTDSIDTSTNAGDRTDVTSVEKHIDTESNLFMNKLSRNNDIESFTESINALLNIAEMPESVDKVASTEYTLFTNQIKPNDEPIAENESNKISHDRSDTRHLSTVENHVTTENTPFTNQVTTNNNINTYTEFIDISTNIDDTADVSSVETHAATENSHNEHMTNKQPNSFSSNSEDSSPTINFTPKDESIEEAVSIFEQSKRSRRIINNLFKMG